MRAFTVAIAMLLLTGEIRAQTTVSFPTEDGGLIYADLYGQGDRAVVLAHGGRFNKESWEKQARVLASAGFRVLAIDFRGYGQSRGPSDSDPMTAPLGLDILAAVRYLHMHGAKTVGRRQHGRGSCRRRIHRLQTGRDRSRRVPGRGTQRTG